MNKKVKDLEIAILHQISRAVLQEHNAALLLKNVLDVLSHEIGFQRGTFTLLRDDTLYIEASQGLTEEEIKRGKYQLGEGITGRVAEIATPILIPDISKDPNFLNRTRTRNKVHDTAFLCVPIVRLEKVIGTLSMDRQVMPDTDLKRDMQLLETVANIMADPLEICLRRHEEREKLLAENQRLRDELDGRTSAPADIIGNCNSMRAVYAKIEQVAATNATVMICGRIGTGKEQTARAIWKKSTRKDKPFISVCCTAMPEHQLDRELFGYEKETADGGTEHFSGRLEAADGGTLYIDEIGELPPALQIKLVRFMQDHSFLPGNMTEPVTLDVRMIAASGQDLDALVKKGAFREDLYYRLNVFPIHLPELRHRRSDIILLAEHFLEKFCRMYGKQINRISTPAINMMMSYHWPGNVRELENCMERAVLSAKDEVVTGSDLPPSLQTADESIITGRPINHSGHADFETLVNSYERELIVEALKVNKGNVSAAARALNLTIRILNYKIRKLNIMPEWYKIRS